jgi:hypothetical protein
MTVEILTVVDEGLGHACHLVAIGDDALVIDPLRRTERYERLAEQRGSRIRWTADTHTEAFLTSRDQSAGDSDRMAGSPAGGWW